MRVLVIFWLSMVAMVVADEGKYTTRFDSIDIDTMIQNRRLLEQHYKCLMDEGKCAPNGKEIKLHIKEALETYCDKCSELQKDATRKVISYLIKHEKEWWRKLSEKYDPERKYITKYERELKSLSET